MNTQQLPIMPLKAGFTKLLKARHIFLLLQYMHYLHEQEGGGGGGGGAQSSLENSKTKNVKITRFVQLMSSDLVTQQLLLNCHVKKTFPHLSDISSREINVTTDVVF